MLKKASAVAAAMTGLMMLGAPAFAVAGEPHDHDHGHHGNHGHHGHWNGDHPGGEWTHYWHAEGGDESNQTGLVNFADDSDVLSNINICQVEVNVIGVPVLSHNDGLNACINTDDDE